MALFAFHHSTFSLKASREGCHGEMSFPFRPPLPRTQIIMNFYDQPINVCRRGIMKQCKMLRNKLIMIKVIIWLLYHRQDGVGLSAEIWRICMSTDGVIYKSSVPNSVKVYVADIFHNLMWSLDAIACNSLTKVAIVSETVTLAAVKFNLPEK